MLSLISSTIVYIFLFISLYFEVFLLITYLEKRGGMKKECSGCISEFPSVTVMVPCFNEEKTISKTVTSLLELDYPKEKLEIFVIDDGSTDGTLAAAKKFENNPQVKIFHKENGGKHTALNFGLEMVKSELVGCLDADSFVGKDTLKKIVAYFNKDKETMAVVPSIKVHNPKNILQRVQGIEYSWGIFRRKLLSYIDALYVTPGPFSIFRREVFENLGNYKKAHLTEDLEMALRMQANNYKIENSHEAYVYTVAPKNLTSLYRQRVRWTYGFLKNVIDYKFMFFKKEYGNLAFFLLPSATISIISAVYLALIFATDIARRFVNEFIKIKTVGFDLYLNWHHFDWFYLNTETISILAVISTTISILVLLISKKMADGKIKVNFDLIFFLVIYPFIAPVWLIKAVYNTVFSRKTLWR